MAEMLLFIASAVVLPLALNEFGDWSPRMSRRIVLWGAQRLKDPAFVSRYSEEWASELDDIPGKLSKLGFALGRLLFLPRILRAHRGIAQRGRSNHKLDPVHDRLHIEVCAQQLSNRLLRQLNVEERKEMALIAGEEGLTSLELTTMVLSEGMMRRYQALRSTNVNFSLPSVETVGWEYHWTGTLLYEEMLDDLIQEANRQDSQELDKSVGH